jgi:hypothetical protein
MLRILILSLWRIPVGRSALADEPSAKTRSTVSAIVWGEGGAGHWRCHPKDGSNKFSPETRMKFSPLYRNRPRPCCETISAFEPYRTGTPSKKNCVSFGSCPVELVLDSFPIRIHGSDKGRGRYRPFHKAVSNPFFHGFISFVERG